MEQAQDFLIDRLGEAAFPSPMKGTGFINERAHILLQSDLDTIRSYLDAGDEPPRFEAAGPRELLYFDPTRVACGIVTCGGLCPGINNVIRAIVLSLRHHYGVNEVYGFPYGFEGLAPRCGHRPMRLTPQLVEHIHEMGGTILGSSRGHQDVRVMVDTLARLGINVLFCIGGDGTQRGALAIDAEARRRGLPLSVIGIPKTIDNDISFMQTTFGFETAVSEARLATSAAHAEALGARNGVGLVKLMGRESGFIAASTVLVDNQVNFCLIPEARFTLEGLLPTLERRLADRCHAVIVVAEGAGQELLTATGECDASGNVKLGDIGVFLRERIRAHFKHIGVELNLKYIDPSYMIRSRQANPHDSAFCLLMGHNAVHAAMSGRTGMIVGYWNHQYTHVPIALAVRERKKIDINGRVWSSVLATTGQAAEIV
ncbi:MAG: ATP-dependent 6-phosphofructokinase [Desulfobulbus sp.]|jgi:6-phosphofructokinase 1|nr:ATP-dependent 6-phosphofructokinase [Desulfobulbus sp.]